MSVLNILSLFSCSVIASSFLPYRIIPAINDRVFFGVFIKRGDFAQAYVIAHGVGHHVQKLLVISDKVHAIRPRLSQKEYNKLSVKMELQADCFSGIWTHHAQKMRNILEPDDVEEALNAASMIGDDRLQKQTRGYVSPDSFTHGTSAQRVAWFNRGFQTGNINSCNTFKAQNL